MAGRHGCQRWCRSQTVSSLTEELYLSTPRADSVPASSIPYKKLTAQNLAQAITAALSQEAQRSARRLGEAIQQEVTILILWFTVQVLINVGFAVARRVLGSSLFPSPPSSASHEMRSPAWKSCRLVVDEICPSVEHARRSGVAGSWVTRTGGP